MYERKPKLTVEQQIEHMKKKGIMFRVCSEKEAEEYLKKNNNYFKLTSYRKNYAKDCNGRYIGLDFAYLRDTAVIDMHVRYCLLLMCLDLEHMMRIHLIKTIEEIPEEDGYTIVADFERRNSDIIKAARANAEKSPYCRDIAEKYRDEMPIWALVEILQFGALCRFYRFVGDRLSNKTMQNEYYLFQEIRQLRNACAHSNCILNDLTSVAEPRHSPDKKMEKELSKIGISKGTKQRKLSNDRIRQITTLLYTYKNYVTSESMKNFRASALHSVFGERMRRHPEYYQETGQLWTTFVYFQKIIDNWYPNCI